MSLDDEDILQEFITESLEHLAEIEGQLLAIESAGADIDVELVNTVFRGVHSIKGCAGFFALTSIGELAHSLENVLNLMRERQLVPTSGIVDVMLTAADSLRGLIEDVKNSNDVDVSNHTSKLNAIATNGDRAVDADANPESLQEQRETEADNQNGDDPASDAQANTQADNTNASVAESDHPDLKETNKTSAVADETPSSDTKAPSRVKSAESNIRVPVETLDVLMNLAGELVLGRNQLLQTVTTKEHGGLDAVAARINQVTSEMQDAIMQTRMQQMGTVFNRFSRVVRDLSGKLGKQCKLVIEGKDVEVDKTIIEAIGDPLTHLVRNSVDHGLENPDVRVAAGKPAEGMVCLKASHQSGKVHIEVRDDGAGIDPEKLKRKAAERGIISADEAALMSDREALRLILHAGFSTAETVSDVSGRGVGMDVVRTNIEKLGGSIEVESQVGKGSAIHVTLPLTLAIIPSLVVQCGQDRFAIPQVSIAELVRVKPEDMGERIGRVKQDEVLRLRGSLLPLVRLSNALGMSSSVVDRGIGDADGRDEVSPEALNIVVVESGQLRYGVIVDRLHDSEEIVVKPLGRHLKSTRCLSGATILGDGRVALILDVSGIAAQLELASVQDADASHTTSVTHEHRSDVHSLLLFRNHPSEQFAVPMSTIARIERIRSEQIDTVGGRLVLQYRGGTLPLLKLDEHITVQAAPERNNVFVIVFAISGGEIGLISPHLEDIRDLAIEVDDSAVTEPGVSGTMVVDGQTTRWIDVSELTRTAIPNWFQKDATNLENRDSGKRPTILLAEDSTFFRKQVAKRLDESGCDVVECEDGLVAWNTLQSIERAIDLVVTDVEMPNMDGLELCRRIKVSPQHGRLPVIALTSLAGDSDIRAGEESGVDEYQIKMDGERLIAAVQRLMNEANGNGHTSPQTASCPQ